MNIFFQHLFRNASMSVAETAEFLYPVAGSGPVDDAAVMYVELKECAHSLIYKALDIEVFKDDKGNFLNVLPDEMNPDKVIKAVSSIYAECVDSVDVEKLVRSAEHSVLVRLEQQIWKHGFNSLAGAIDVMLKNLHDTSEQYVRLQEQPDRTAVDKSYADAVKCSLTEKVVKNNVDDILIYRQDMIEYLEKVCDNMMYSLWEKFFGILSCSSLFADAQSRINVFTARLASIGIQSTDDVAYQLPESLENTTDLIYMDMSSDVQSALDKATVVAF